jgi:myo-inositol-1(or 4)-monophosphatase
MDKRQKDLDRILEALREGEKAYRSRPMDSVCLQHKSGGDPVTDVEREVNQLLFEMLVRDGEGWLSEETEDSDDRLKCSRIWIVDPLDGTKEYVSRIPEWCISIALLDEGRLAAGGICNPLTGELFYGSCETGLVYECESPNQMENSDSSSQDPLVLASRSEVKRGEWERFRNATLRVKPMGSVAYKLALVAAGKADATWTLVPKHEWDVAGGVALVQASGGCVLMSHGTLPAFNKCDLLFPGLVAFSQSGVERLQPFLDQAASDPVFQDCLPWVSALNQRRLRVSLCRDSYSS